MWTPQWLRTGCQGCRDSYWRRRRRSGRPIGAGSSCSCRANTTSLFFFYKHNMSTISYVSFLCDSEAAEESLEYFFSVSLTVRKEVCVSVDGQSPTRAAAVWAGNMNTLIFTHTHTLSYCAHVLSPGQRSVPFLPLLSRLSPLPYLAGEIKQGCVWKHSCASISSSLVLHLGNTWDTHPLSYRPAKHTHTQRYELPEKDVSGADLWLHLCHVSLSQFASLMLIHMFRLITSGS